MTSPVRLSDIVGGGYDSFWNSRKRYRVLKGGKASKKSTTTALNLIYRLLKYPESNILVVRAVMNTHRDSTFAQLKWAQEKLGVSHLFKNNVSPLEMTYLPTGQKILFRGFDDVLKLASTTVENGYLNFVWIEEAFEIESLSNFEKLDLSVPRGKIPPHLFKQTTLTFNPWSEKHWLKARFFDAPASDTAVFSTNYLINEFLDDTDRAIFEKLKREHPRRYAVAGLGEWGISEGLVFENWCEGQIDTSNGDWKAFFGLDYGYTTDPTAFIAMAVNPTEKVIYIYDEMYEKRLLNSDIVAKIKTMGYSKERIVADSAEPKTNDTLRRDGLRIVSSVKGADSVRAGIQQLQEYRFIVHPNCKNTVAELSNYTWQTDKEGKPTGYPKDSDNHLMDAMRYAMQDLRGFGAVKTPQRKSRFNLVSADDFKGGWK